MIRDLADQMDRHLVMILFSGGGVALCRVGVGRDTDAVTLPDIGIGVVDGPRRVQRIHQKFRGRHRRLAPGNDPQFSFIGDDEKLPGMPHGLVGQQKDRRPEYLGQIEAFDGQIEGLLDVHRRQRDDRIVPAGGTVLHRVEIALADPGGDPVAGPRPLHVHHHVGKLVLDPPAQAFELQTDARTRGDGHGLHAGNGCASHRMDRGQFILHLDRHAAHFGKALRNRFRDL